MNYLQRQNLECRIEWNRRYLYQIKYADIREPLLIPLFDRDYADKRRLARALLKEIKGRTRRFPSWASNVMFLRKQAI